VPRLLNQAAHQALLLACAAGSAAVDAEAALEALALLGLQKDEEPEASPSLAPVGEPGAGEGESPAEAPTGGASTLRLDPGEEQPSETGPPGNAGACAYRLFGAPRPA
jgi:hypothetical protein